MLDVERLDLLRKYDDDAIIIIMISGIQMWREM